MGDTQKLTPDEQIRSAFEAYEAGTDLTVAVEEEFAILDPPPCRRNDEILRYVVWRNNTFGLHVHVGIRGADRAVAVCNLLRNYLPELLALSASSPFVEGVDSGLHSARTEIFTRTFPRC